MTDRYARHDLIPGWRQDRLSKSTAVIAGVGALGNEVARLLAMAGIGGLLLCDPDVVSESNLSRTVLFRGTDMGRPKVEAAADALRELSPGIEVEPIAATHVSGVGLARLRDADLVVSCLDSMAARISLASRCNAVDAGLLDAGTDPWGGQVCYYRPGGACLGCGLSARQRALRDDPWSCAGPVADPVAGASAPVSALLGAWEATMALRVLFDLPVSESALIVDSIGEVDRSERARNPTCPLHEPLDPSLVEPVGTVTTVAELVGLLAPGEEAFSWVALPGGTSLLRSAPPDKPLTEVGVAREEILPVARRSDGAVIRYLELGKRRP
ncbi:HesA/MoeB/ThiF family protein [Actinomadura scrupuli]|uniref:HesA/MoeB/ThiF family protein n=1 Tax=Actinomadura scrupuli TaxID=559629 RepID=UPI003D97366C